MTSFLRSLRLLSLAATSALAFGFFLFPSGAMAATTLTLDPLPAATYEVYSGLGYPFAVKATNNVFETDVTAEIALVKNNNNNFNILLFSPIATHTFTKMAVAPAPNNNPHVFSWDGKLNGAYVSPGKYRLRITGKDANNDDSAAITHDFEVTEEAQTLVTSAPENWVTGGSPYSVAFSLKTAAPACVLLSVEGKVVSYMPLLSAGGYHLNWDGKLDNAAVAPGLYNWELNVANTNFCSSKAEVSGTTASGKVTVTNPLVINPVGAPAVSNLGVSIDPFSPNGDNFQDSTSISFSLGSQADVTVSVENPNGVNIRTLENALATPAGLVSLAWNGKDTGGSVVSTGKYKIAVIAKNANGTTQASTTVQVNSNEAPAALCAGFKDVAADDPYCPAIKFVQSIGAMTGYANGDFGQDDALQRDQIAKISLTTFKKFGANSDYCLGKSPFPDVSLAKDWSAQYVCRGVKLGMITGYASGTDAGYFRPARIVNTVEFLAFILRNLGESMPSDNSVSYDDVGTGLWFSGLAKYAYDHSLFAGNKLYPTKQMTRGEVARVLLKLHDLGKL